MESVTAKGLEVFATRALHELIILYDKKMTDVFSLALVQKETQNEKILARIKNN